MARCKKKKVALDAVFYKGSPINSKFIKDFL